MFKLLECAAKLRNSASCILQRNGSDYSKVVIIHTHDLLIMNSAASMCVLPGIIHLSAILIITALIAPIILDWIISYIQISLILLHQPIFSVCFIQI